MNSYTCENCNIPCGLIAYSNISDGKVWYCRNCKNRKSICYHSFFDKSHVSLHNFLIVVHCWSRDMFQIDIMHEFSIQSRTTIIDWTNFCRDICNAWLQQNPMKIGGINKNGEIKFFHRKHHRGEWRPGHWFSGGIERISKEISKAVLLVYHAPFYLCKFKTKLEFFIFTNVN